MAKIVLFGSVAKNEARPESDIDVLVFAFDGSEALRESESLQKLAEVYLAEAERALSAGDFRIAIDAAYNAADICLKYNLNLSPRVWSTAHRRPVEELQTLLYRQYLPRRH